MAKGRIKADTLLRKIQKGSSTLSSKVSTGISKTIPGINFNFDGSIQMFKKREIVQPYLHPIDSRMINDQVEKTVKQNLKSIDPEIDKNYDKLLPKHLVNDLYSLYYNPTGRLKFDSLDKTNKVKFDILDSINNSLTKIVTNNSHIGSYVYTEEIGKFLYKKFMALPPEQRQKLQDALNNCNQGGGGSGQNQPQPQGGGQGQPPPGQQPQQKPQPGGGGGSGQPQPQQSRPEGQDNNEEDEEQDQPNNGQNKDKSDEDPDSEAPQQDYEDQDEYHNTDSDPNAQSQRNGDNNSRGAANNGRGNSKKDMSQDAADQMDKDLKDMVNMLNSKQSKEELKQAFKQAEQKLDKLRDMGVDLENDEEMPEEEKKEIIQNLNNLDSIRASLRSLSVSKEKLMKAVEKILNGTTNYFSQKCITKDVELFEADQLLDINGIELLHPFFRKSRMFDLSVTERKYIGKFDLYVDCSGSMSSGCGGDLSGVPRIDLAKSLAMQMKELGILGDLYEFEGRPKKILNSDISILMMAARGSTDIENVIKNVLKSGNNSVILSDGESDVSTYTHKALFIGVGTDFHYFRRDVGGVGQKFIEESQCIHYDGKNFVESTMTNGSGVRPYNW